MTELSLPTQPAARVQCEPCVPRLDGKPFRCDDAKPLLRSKQPYAERAGIEGVHAQTVRRMGLRRSRYVGEPRTHLQHVAMVAALNLCDWLTGASPHLTPLSHFARFMKEIA